MDSIAARLENVFEDIFWGGSTPMREMNRFSSASWDSLAHLNLMLAIEEEFQISLTDDEVIELNSFDAAVAIINDKQTR